MCREAHRSRLTPLPRSFNPSLCLLASCRVRGPEFDFHLFLDSVVGETPPPRCRASLLPRSPARAGCRCIRRFTSCASCVPVACLSNGVRGGRLWLLTGWPRNWMLFSNATILFNKWLIDEAGFSASTPSTSTRSSLTKLRIPYAIPRNHHPPEPR